MDTYFNTPKLDPEPRLARARALDARLVAARRAQRAAEHQLALLLAEMAEGELYRVLGYISLENYAFVALELTWRTARDLLRLGRCLPDLPVMNAAMAAGQIDWTKARELIRVATPETEPTCFPCDVPDVVHIVRQQRRSFDSIRNTAYSVRHTSDTKVLMARNNISLSITPSNSPKGYEGPWKIRWREDVITDGKRERQARSQIVSDKGARDTLVGKLRRSLEAGDVFTPEARVVTTPGNLELAALAWLRWQASRDRKEGTRQKYTSAISRIMGTIRQVSKIKADEVIPVTVLGIELFAAIRNVWIAEDAKAQGTASRKRSASPMRRYHLSGFLYSVWSHAASQPAIYARVPPLVDRGLVIPPVPAQPGAPPAPTWTECDYIVRRAYVESEDLGDVLASERLTGLRVDQVASIRRRAIDTVACTLVVEVGKGKQEVADKRTIPVPRSLIELWQPRIKACTSPDDYLFPAPGRECGHMEPDTKKIAGLWLDAEKAGEVRMNLYKPLTSRKGRPNHAFRAAYMAGLEGITVEVDGAPVQRVKDRTIDFLVAHRPMDTRSRHYTPPSWKMLVAAVGFVEPLDLKGPTAEGCENVVAGPW